MTDPAIKSFIKFFSTCDGLLREGVELSYEPHYEHHVLFLQTEDDLKTPERLKAVKRCAMLHLPESRNPAVDALLNSSCTEEDVRTIFSDGKKDDVAVAYFAYLSEVRHPLFLTMKRWLQCPEKNFWRNPRIVFGSADKPTDLEKIVEAMWAIKGSYYRKVTSVVVFLADTSKRPVVKKLIDVTYGKQLSLSFE